MQSGTTQAKGAKTAIVTGGSRGIGRAAVLALAQRGTRSILTYKSDKHAAEEVVALTSDKGVPAVALPLDTADASSFGAFADEIRQVLADWRISGFDYLANNAGISSTATFADADEAELDRHFAIHFKGVFLLSQNLVPMMNDGGRIVNISSGLARFAMNGRAVYGPMKAAVEALTRYMALELGPRRIAVNTVAPGAIATDFSGGIVRDNPAVNKMVSEHTALGRVGLPEDVGSVIAALLSEDMAWVNAQRIEVTGGMHI